VNDLHLQCLSSGSTLASSRSPWATSLEVNLDLVANGDTESAAIVVPADAAGTPHAEVVSYTNP